MSDSTRLNIDNDEGGGDIPSPDDPIPPQPDEPDIPPHTEEQLLKSERKYP